MRSEAKDNKYLEQILQQGDDSLRYVSSEVHDPKWGAQQLKNISIFKNFTDEELTELYAIGEFISFKPQSYVVVEGEPTRGLYIILYGTVSVYKNDIITGNMHRIAYLETGNNFGELSLFDNSPRSASVCAETDCYMFYLDSQKFNEFLQKKGQDIKVRFYKTCAEDLVARFRNLNNDYIISQQLLWKYALRLKNEDEMQNQEKIKGNKKSISAVKIKANSN